MLPQHTETSPTARLAKSNTPLLTPWLPLRLNTSLKQAGVHGFMMCPLDIGSLYCEAFVMEVDKLLSCVCALQLEALALHVTSISKSRADLFHAPCKMHQ